MKLITMKGVTKLYSKGEHEQRALDSVDLEIDEGKFVVILGPSGAGKSTLLNMIGGLDSPTSGTIIVDGQNIEALSRDELADYRASTVGSRCSRMWRLSRTYPRIRSARTTCFAPSDSRII